MSFSRRPDEGEGWREARRDGGKREGGGFKIVDLSDLERVEEVYAYI